jgi:hypothetical protein
MQVIKEYLDVYNSKSTDSKLDGVSRFTKFLWWCAGADRQLLMQSPMADRVKYAGIGGLVFSTGLLASVSGGYAFYTIFSPKGDAVNIDPVHIPSIIGSFIFGIIWGLIILNMDRFIVSSTGKDFDGGDRITGKELVGAIPRILIATILGFAISAPLEVRILQTEIDAELQNKQDDYLMELNMKTDSITNFQMINKKTDLAKVENEINSIEIGFEKQRIEIQDARKRLEDEIAGRIGSGKSGEGPAAKAQKENLNKQEKELAEKKKGKEPEIIALKDRLKRLNIEIDEFDKGRDEKYEKNKLQAHQLDGLMKRIEISHEIGGWVPRIILLIFLSIEAGPIFFKMMMTKGAYDYLVENNTKRFEANNGIVFAKKLVHGKDGALHAENVDFLEVDNEIEAKKQQINKQAELTTEVIQQWQQKKKKDISENPENFYSEEK